ncbi:glutamate--tRNA ligase [Candidatus Wolfebacteria bacterium CG03_land_8_20_14_0_80_36_15]|uniref:Glutamate--tRNA ligase n=1 Tax=Candidatus Wolfebacteria bacterium CG03_land_8_20_14_0_80_36_15 TaxID=1975067 RepID=A0A2M7B7P9_9BACT|nr:MAG: glutamate--tRNA ligase [Candidatus Wolfebacteria bacterium CG03_land_8_20_14_0_80_36_15]
MIDNPKIEVRVRFAPSPTGYFHVGTARTALFNWLFARNQGGKFILRIEDTDLERSKKEYENDVLNSLKWLGLDWDEGPDRGDFGPYRQSERLSIYERSLTLLLTKNKAYWCFCTKEDLEIERQEMLSQGLAPKYSGKCGKITLKEAENRLKLGEKAVVRLRVPQTEITFSDIIRETIKFDTSLLGDIIIAKSLKEPLFNFAVVVDDAEMKITHIIRGEDHIPNTPKQILIQKSLGFPQPKYAHLPLILAADRSKLSKRYIETSLNEYRKAGYLPEAMINFIAYLGWHPKEEKDIMSKEELIKEFDLKRVQKANAIFNPTKFDWLNAQYIRRIPEQEVGERLKDFAPTDWLKNKRLLIKVFNLEKERIKKLSGFKEAGEFFFEIPDYKSELLSWKETEKEKVISNLKILVEEIEEIDEKDFVLEKIENKIMPLTEALGKGELLWPLRVALSGREGSPGPFEIMDVLGKEESLQRLKVAIKKLS